MSTEAASIKANAASFWPIVAIIFFGSFVGMYHVVSLNVSLPGFMLIFNTDLQGVQWIITGFMLTCGMVAPIAGYTMKRFGTKRSFLFTLAGISVMSLLCSLSWNISSLIAFRVLQGLFCGLIAPITLAMVYSLIHEHKQVLALSIWSFSTVFSTSIGPTLSGWLQSFNWHFIFLITLPVGVAVTLCAAIVLPADKGDPSISLDWRGLVLASLASLSLLLVFGNMSVWGWSSGWTWALLVTGIISGLLFVYHELQVKQPLLHLALFANKAFLQSLLASLLLSFALYSGIYFVPLFLQEMHGMSSFEIGLMFLPASVSLTIATFLSGKLYNKLGAVKLLLIGSSLLIVTTVSLGYLTPATSLLTIMIILAIRNIGTGLSMTPMTNISMSSVALEHRAHASALVNWLRQMFSAIIIGVFTSFFFARMNVYEQKLAETTPATETWHNQMSYMLSNRDSFLFASLFLMLVIPLAFLLRKSILSAKRFSQNKYVEQQS